MNWKDKIEKKVGWIVIPRLLRYISAAQFLVFILVKLVPGYLEYLTLDPSAILRGQLWRAVSWTFVPQTTSYLWILFSVLWLWFMGDFLESSWGALRTNIFFWLGMAGGISAAFLTWNSGSIIFRSCLHLPLWNQSTRSISFFCLAELSGWHGPAFLSFFIPSASPQS